MRYLTVEDNPQKTSCTMAGHVLEALGGPFIVLSVFNRKLSPVIGLYPDFSSTLCENLTVLNI